MATLIRIVREADLARWGALEDAICLAALAVLIGAGFSLGALV